MIDPVLTASLSSTRFSGLAFYEYNKVMPFDNLPMRTAGSRELWMQGLNRLMVALPMAPLVSAELEPPLQRVVGSGR